MTLHLAEFCIQKWSIFTGSLRATLEVAWVFASIFTPRKRSLRYGHVLHLSEIHSVHRRRGAVKGEVPGKGKCHEWGAVKGVPWRVALWKGCHEGGSVKGCHEGSSEHLPFLVNKRSVLILLECFLFCGFSLAFWSRDIMLAPEESPLWNFYNIYFSKRLLNQETMKYQKKFLPLSRFYSQWVLSPYCLTFCFKKNHKENGGFVVLILLAVNENYLFVFTASNSINLCEGGRREIRVRSHGATAKEKAILFFF